MFGMCRLCLQQAELQDSHLLPRALYRMIGRGTDRLHPDTVQLTLNSQRKSSEQARRHLLCSRCEQCLNQNGEKWVLHNCYRSQGQFRLRSEVRKRTILSGPEIEAYSASDEEKARLAYFCLSVVWRASLCDWFSRGQRYEHLNLGPYQEEIRKYLRGDTVIPNHVGVMVILSALERPVLVMSLPFSYRANSKHCHRFNIPGVTFVVTVGGREEDRLSVVQPPYPILIGTMGDQLAQDKMMLLLGKTPPHGFKSPLVEGTEKV